MEDTSMSDYVADRNEAMRTATEEMFSTMVRVRAEKQTFNTAKNNPLPVNDELMNELMNGQN